MQIHRNSLRNLRSSRVAYPEHSSAPYPSSPPRDHGAGAGAPRGWGGAPPPEPWGPLAVAGGGGGGGRGIDGLGPATRQRRYLQLSESDQATFLNDWALYLSDLGRLEAAAHCYELNIEMRMQQENWNDASIGNQNLCDVRLLAGKVAGGRMKDAPGDPSLPPSSFRLHPSEEALRLAEIADGAHSRKCSYAYRGQVHTLRGEVAAALADFREALDWQVKVEGDDKHPLYSIYGIWHTQLLAQLGQRDESQRLTETNQEICRGLVGAGNIFEPKCRLILAELQLASGDVSAAERLSHAARDWALARDAKEVLCWSALVQARIELAHATTSPHRPRVGGNMTGSYTANEDANDYGEVGPEVAAGHRSTDTGSVGGGHLTLPLSAAQSALDEGLKIARACGFSLFHIDLQLEVARLTLLQGSPSEALAALRTALDESRPANAQTGEPELLAANDPACGYAWPIPEGIQLRAEALLLLAAQELGESQFDPKTRDQLPANVGELVDQAEACLTESLDLWRPLRDPARKNANFRHPKTRRHYNHRAEETHRVLTALEQGQLTRYAVAKVAKTFSPTQEHATDSDTTAPKLLTSFAPEDSQMSKRFDVALSFPGEHRRFVEAIAIDLEAQLTREKVFYDRFYEAELARPNLDTYLQKIYHDDTELIVVFLCEDYNNKEWCHLEARAIRDLIKKRRDDEIMFIRVDDGSVDGVFSVDGYVDGQGHPATEISALIVQRLRMLSTSNPQ